MSSSVIDWFKEKASDLSTGIVDFADDILDAGGEAVKSVSENATDWFTAYLKAPSNNQPYPSTSIDYNNVPNIEGNPNVAKSFSDFFDSKEFKYLAIGTVGLLGVYIATRR